MAARDLRRRPAARCPTPGVNSFLRLWTVARRWRNAGAVADASRIRRLRCLPTASALHIRPLGAQPCSRAGGPRTRVAPVAALPRRTHRADSHHESRDFSGEKLPWTNSNDTDPMWVGNTIYFLSDRDRTVNLYAYEHGTQASSTQLTHHNDFDIMTRRRARTRSCTSRRATCTCSTRKSGQSQQLNIDAVGDFPWARPQMKRVASLIGDATLSPTGARAAFEARGDIFTVPRRRQLPQHHAELRRARSQSGMVAGRQADRVVLR